MELVKDLLVPLTIRCRSVIRLAKSPSLEERTFGQSREKDWEHLGKSGKHMGKSGKHLGKSGKDMGKTGKDLGKSGKDMGKSGKDMDNLWAETGTTMDLLWGWSKGSIEKDWETPYFLILRFSNLMRLNVKNISLRKYPPYHGLFFSDKKQKWKQILPKWKRHLQVACNFSDVCIRQRA